MLKKAALFDGSILYVPFCSCWLELGSKEGPLALQKWKFIRSSYASAVWCYVTAFKFLSSTATVLEGRLVFWKIFRRAPLVKVPSISHITFAFPFNGSDITCTL
uniref:Uncharacterized protein n=1 Tax=Populus davidiana TaxID=266767 RepID=A0A6M2F504_9ROSI